GGSGRGAAEERSPGRKPGVVCPETLCPDRGERCAPSIAPPGLGSTPTRTPGCAGGYVLAAAPRRRAAKRCTARTLAHPNPSIRGVGAPMDGLSALPWTARWCQGTLPWPNGLLDLWPPTLWAA